jgi:hypothetical protein
MELSLLKTFIRSKRNPFRNAFLSLLGITIPLGLGVYNNKVDNSEGYHEFYTFPKTAARPLILTYGADGIFHRLISPHTIGGTLGLTNTGKPVKIKMNLVGVPKGLTIHWGSSHTRDFNLTTKTIERILSRGDSVSVHHTFYLGENLRQKAVLFRGGLEITDEATGNKLLTIPIRILNADGSLPQPTEDSCHGC